jgi:helicase
MADEKGGITQAELMESGMLHAGLSVVLQAPTGWGKTWVSEQEIVREFSAGLKAIYLAPVRVLAEEICARWSRVMQGAKVGIFTGEYGTEDRPFAVPFEEADVLVMTPERLDLCTRDWKKHLPWMARVSLVIVDELHTLADGRRGARLEGAISRFMRLCPLARLIGMSATLGNRSELARWLGGIAVHSTDRPVPIEWRVVRFKKVSDKLQCAVDVVAKCVAEGGTSLVFCQSRKRTQEVAAVLMETGIKADFHHAGRSRADRHRVEAAVRARSLECVVATGTLAVGVNLPVRQVVLYDIQRWTGRGYESLGTNELWQRGGRAGRRGLDTRGEVVLVAHHRDPDASRILEGGFEPIRSTLRDPRLLAEQMLVECGAGLAHTRTHLRRIGAASLAAATGYVVEVDRVVASMVEAGMLRTVPAEEGEDRLRATRLGRVAVRQMVCPETVQLARRMATRCMNWGVVDAMVLAAASEDMGARLLGDLESGYGIEADLVRAGSAIASAGCAAAAALLKLDDKEWMGVARTVMVMKWACELGTEAASEKGECSDAEVDAMCEQAQRVAQAIAAVMQVLQEDESLPAGEREGAKRLRTLSSLSSAALKARLWGEAGAIAMLDGVGHVMARRLVGAGFSGLEDIALADEQDLVAIEGVGEARAKAWSEQAGELVKDEWLTEALAERAGYVEVAVQLGGGAGYESRRASELRVEGSTGDEVVLVTGGGDLREVWRKDGRWSCTCKASPSAQSCKHLLAVEAWEATTVMEGERA